LKDVKDDNKTEVSQVPEMPHLNLEQLPPCKFQTGRGQGGEKTKKC